MCFHTENEMITALSRHHPDSVAAVILRTSKGDFYAAWWCDPTDAYSITNTVRNLKVWHPLAGAWADLSRVNEARYRQGLAPLVEQNLPKPNRPPLPSIDGGTGPGFADRVRQLAGLGARRRLRDAETV